MKTRARLLLIVLLCCLSLGTASSRGRARADEPTAPRPLLGLSIEPVGGGRFQARDGAVVLAEGRLAECERARLARLVALHGTGNANVVTPTLGGKQLWADAFALAGWRIQRHVWTGHHRLLDADDARRAWGSYAECRVALEAQRLERGLRPRSRHAVVLLHGWIRSKDSLPALTEALEAAGYEVVALSYPSTRAPIEEHAAQLNEVLERLEGVDRVSFVTHSLGGPVVRTALARPSPWRERLTVHRVVMIFPPSNGSALAARWGGNPLFRAFGGPVGAQLHPDAAGRIPPPRDPFLVIAGGRGDGVGRSARVPGDDDGTVGVEEARLPGGPCVVHDVGHTFGMNDPRVVADTLRFLRD
jgi:hypothetical protein